MIASLTHQAEPAQSRETSQVSQELERPSLVEKLFGRDRLPGG